MVGSTAVEGVSFGKNMCYLNAVYQLIRCVAAYDAGVRKHVLMRFDKWDTPFDAHTQEDAHECLLSIYDQLMKVRKGWEGVVDSVVQCPLTGESSTVSEAFHILSVDVHRTLDIAVDADTKELVVFAFGET